MINVASVSGKRPLPSGTPHTASKMAVVGPTTTLAHEVGPLGVAVKTLSSGPVRGPRMERNFWLEAERTGTTDDAVVAMLHLPGLCAADIGLSADMVGRRANSS